MSYNNITANPYNKKLEVTSTLVRVTHSAVDDDAQSMGAWSGQNGVNSCFGGSIADDSRYEDSLDNGSMTEAWIIQSQRKFSDDWKEFPAEDMVKDDNGNRGDDESQDEMQDEASSEAEIQLFATNGFPLDHPLAPAYDMNESRRLTRNMEHYTDLDLKLLNELIPGFDTLSGPTVEYEMATSIAVYWKEFNNRFREKFPHTTDISLASYHTIHSATMDRCQEKCHKETKAEQIKAFTSAHNSEQLGAFTSAHLEAAWHSEQPGIHSGAQSLRTNGVMDPYEME